MQVNLWSEVVLQASPYTYTVKYKDIHTTHTCMQPGPERLEESHTQITVVMIVTAAAKGGVHDPTSCPVLGAYYNESMSLHLGKPHL